MSEPQKDVGGEGESTPPSADSKKVSRRPMIEAIEGGATRTFISADASDLTDIAQRPTRLWRPIGGCILLALVGLLLVASGREIVTRTRRARSAQQLSALGMAVQFYSNGNREGQFPDSLSTLMIEESIPPEVFVYPGGSDTPASGATWQVQQADFARPGHCSYLYFGAGLSNAGDSNTVVACERSISETASGMNVLFLDGHVEYVTGAACQQLRAALASGPVAWTSTGGIRRPATLPTTRP